MIIIAIDNNDNIYAMGYTYSADFPTVNAYDASLNALRDGFVTKLSSAGFVEYSTFIGGTSDQYLNDIAVSGEGNAILVGQTSSADYPTMNAFDADFGGETDVVVTKFSISGTQLVYSTFLGGTRDDFGNDIAVDNEGAVYVSGTTRSEDFPILNAFDPTPSDLSGQFDAFITKFAPFPEITCGDVDGSGEVNIGDAVYLINYIFAYGAAPVDPEGGDTNCDVSTNITDAVVLINYIFASGPAPCEACP